MRSSILTLSESKRYTKEARLNLAFASLGSFRTMLSYREMAYVKRLHGRARRTPIWHYPCNAHDTDANVILQ